MLSSLQRRPPSPRFFISIVFGIHAARSQPRMMIRFGAYLLRHVRRHHHRGELAYVGASSTEHSASLC